MHYEPLIEQLETWRDTLAALPLAAKDPALRRVIVGMNDVVSDLRRESPSPAETMRAHLDTFGRNRGICGECGNEVDFDEHDREVCTARVETLPAMRGRR